MSFGKVDPMTMRTSGYHNSNRMSFIEWFDTEHRLRDFLLVE